MLIIKYTCTNCALGRICSAAAPKKTIQCVSLSIWPGNGAHGTRIMAMFLYKAFQVPQPFLVQLANQKVYQN